MKKQRAEELINKYIQGDITPEERLLVEQWFLNDLKKSDYVPDEHSINTAAERIRANLINHVGLQKPAHAITKLWPRIAAAASILLIIGIGSYFLLKKIAPVSQIAGTNVAHDIAPGGNNAVLTLANGKKILLSMAQNGMLAVQGGSIIKKTANGQLVYNNGGSNKTAEITYNTLTTPRGGQYLVILPDSTRVMLNAASTLKYPTAFTGNERKVELSGEAYFEVAHNKHLPFRVMSNGQMVEVLGTHFNINAYNDEPGIRTTLLEGSVRVSENGRTAVLKPGQQSIIQSADNYHNNNSIIVKEADTEQAIAWTNGEFSFNKTDIQTVMRQVSRWYNVDVQYAGKIPGDRLSGTFSRNMEASKALKLLEFTGINFKIEGRKIIVK